MGEGGEGGIVAVEQLFMAIGVVQFVDIFLHSSVLQGSFLTVQIS